MLHAKKEGLKGRVQTSQHILHDLGVEVLVLGPLRFDVGQLGAVAGHGDVHATHAPGFPTLLQARIVEFPTPAQDKPQRPFLLGSGLEFVLESLAHALLIHMSLFCLADAQPARVGAIHPPTEDRGLSGPVLVSISGNTVVVGAAHAATISCSSGPKDTRTTPEHSGSEHEEMPSTKEAERWRKPFWSPAVTAALVV